MTEETMQRGQLGPRQAETSATYSKAGMWSVLVISCVLAIAGLVMCFAWVGEQNISGIVVGVFMILIGNYVLIAAVKEKANLDLIASHFKNLSPETQDELIRKLFQNSLGSSAGVIRLIETTLNVFFKKANL